LKLFITEKINFFSRLLPSRRTWKGDQSISTKF